MNASASEFPMIFRSILVGSRRVGASRSATRTVNVPARLASGVRATHRTWVVPIGKIDPDAREQLTTPRVAVAEYVTRAPSAPVASTVSGCGSDNFSAEKDAPPFSDEKNVVCRWPTS
jgi:hypothetical protein